MFKRLILTLLTTAALTGLAAPAFAQAAVVWEREEDGWIGLAMKKS